MRSYYQVANRKLTVFVFLQCVIVSGLAFAQASCPIESSTIENAKPNKLYLYFPTADDSGFPPTACTPGTTGCYSDVPDTGSVSPLKAFDITKLSSYTGTVAALRDQIRDVVIDDYCEFNVKVLETTTVPPSTFARRDVIGIGTDSATLGGGSLFGEAQEVDVSDPTIFDSARVWGGTYQTLAGGAGGALNGTNSTLQRWGFSIGGTAAHEAGHTYGLAHSDDFTETSSSVCTGTDHTKPGEDALTRHLMARGCHFTDEQRASFRRHFSDVTFSILAANVGLSVETVHNWDFTNPNSAAASQLQYEVLSTSPALTVSWYYNGASSPWISPTVNGPIGTTTFKGTTYNRFQLTWSTAQSWANGSPGTVPGGANFHVGAAFSEADFGVPDSVIVVKVTLLDSGGSPLTLQPRMVGYDTGALDAADGAYNLNFFTIDDPARPLLIGNLTVTELPRLLSIGSMVRGGKMETWQGLPFASWSSPQRKLCDRPEQAVREGCFVRLSETATVIAAKLSQGRHVAQFYDGKCPLVAGGGPSDSSKPTDVNNCPEKGYSLDLFPSTTIYVTATIVDPAAKHWDPAQNTFVTGPVESRLFYQIAGRHPDLNRNGIDDYIDIANGRSKDLNKDGVPDEAQKCLPYLRRVEACEREERNANLELSDLSRRDKDLASCARLCEKRPESERCIQDCQLRQERLLNDEVGAYQKSCRQKESCGRELQEFKRCEQENSRADKS